MDKWAELKRLQSINEGRHILDLMDESRATNFSAIADGMLFDYAKTNIDPETRAALIALADASGVAEKYSLSEIGRRMPSPPRRASRAWLGVGCGTLR